MKTLALSIVACLCLAPLSTAGADPPRDTARGDRMLADYFRAETRRLADASLVDIRSKEDWTARRDEARRQLREMLGLDPLPERTPLEPVVTGRIEHDEFTVENLHFQSRPGLYVTGNLYVPKGLVGKAPAILYVCGHGQVKRDGISYGNKAHYQHHGAWFARNGYVCLVIDTLQLGEIEGLHHGTHRFGMWWWNARGYTPAGVEAWNGIRALDYLETRPEVDAERMGVTGRSGGGAYSWWIAALDERIKAAVPVAGITSLQNHVVDGVVEGHCDCMFQVNTYRWDYPEVAALVAPRPLLISNTDKDGIFPLDGVVDVYFKVRRLYELHGVPRQLGLHITEGPHQDTQELQIHALVWFNRFLMREEWPIETAAVKLLEPAQLKVFDRLPEDERNTTIHETFTVQAGSPAVPETVEEWERQRTEWLTVLREKSFGGWPAESGGAAGLDVREAFSVEHGPVRLTAWDFTSQEHIRLRLWLAHRAGLEAGDLDLVVLNALDDQGWSEFLAAMQAGFAEQFDGETLPESDEEAFARLARMFESHKWGMAYVAPRGVGPTEWNRDERKRTHIRRRFMLLGQTLDGMRVWDIRRAVQALRSVDGVKQVPVWLQGERETSGLALYASLFEPDIARLDLYGLSRSHREGPDFLNVLRFLDVPQAVALAASRSQVVLYGSDAAEWEYPQAVARSLGWDAKRLQWRRPAGDAE